MRLGSWLSAFIGAALRNVRVMSSPVQKGFVAPSSWPLCPLPWHHLLVHVWIALVALTNSICSLSQLACIGSWCSESCGSSHSSGLLSLFCMEVCAQAERIRILEGRLKTPLHVWWSLPGRWRACRPSLRALRKTPSFAGLRQFSCTLSIGWNPPAASWYWDSGTHPWKSSMGWPSSYPYLSYTPRTSAYWSAAAPRGFSWTAAGPFALASSLDFERFLKPCVQSIVRGSHQSGDCLFWRSLWVRYWRQGWLGLKSYLLLIPWDRKPRPSAMGLRRSAYYTTSWKSWLRQSSPTCSFEPWISL